MLASVIGLFVVSGEQLGAGTFTWVDLQRMAANVPESTQIWLFLGFFVAFAIKAPLVPFHTWLPDAGAEAPDRGGRAARRRAGQGGHVRLPALLPAAVPARVAAASPRWC